MSKIHRRDQNHRRDLSVAPEEPEGERLLSPDPLAHRLRSMVREFIEKAFQEELDAALQASRYERQEGPGAERRGDRHGTRERELTTSIGTDTIAVGSDA